MIIALTNLAITAMQQATTLHQRQANGEPITEADIQTAQAETKRLMDESDALRSTPRRPQP